MTQNRERKRRFGISIPEKLAQNLDKLAEKLNSNRSEIVHQALKEYIHDHLHYLVPHECRGVIIILGEKEHGKLFNVIEEYHAIICNYNHTHAEEHCISTLIVSGPSNKIAELHKKLREIPGVKVRYIPISYDII